MVSVFKVNIEVTGSGNEPVIKTVEYYRDEVPYTQEPQEKSSNMPGVYVIVYGTREGMDTFQPYTKWTSTSYHGSGKYRLTAGFLFEPEKGELMKVQVKIIDNSGNTIALKEFNIVWEYEPVLSATCDVNTINSTTGFSNVSVLKEWVDPASISERATEHLPGVFLVVKKDGIVMNHASSTPYQDDGRYNIRAFFEDEPKIGERLDLTIQIMNSQGGMIAQYPQSGENFYKIWA